MTESVRAFERGLRVIRTFHAGAPAMTLSEVARAADLNRATARRLLMTLEELGYARNRNGRFELTARVMDLGYAFVSSFGVPELAMPHLERLSAEVNESASAGVLDDTDIVYIARVPAKRVMTVSIGLGSRFPAYRTSMGRAILASMEDDVVRELWDRSDHADPTPRTITSVRSLLAELATVRDRGWAIVDQELEIGVRSVAVPIRDGQGRTIAAMNVSTHASRTSSSELVRTFVPALRRAVAGLESEIAHRR